MRITPRDLPLLARVLIRTYGWRGISRRVAYELSHRSGHLARVLPAQDRLTPAEPGWSWPLRFDLDEIRRGYERLEELDAIREEVVADAERVLAGEMHFYGWTWKRTEWPPRWHVNPSTGYEYPRDHFTRISDFAPENGDIKDVWEMSRLPFTYLFARAWVLTDDDRYPEAWWRAVEDWAEHNPPNRGVNWKCGQETSLRGIALQFGLMTFADHPSTTPQRLRLVGGLLQASVRRVLPTLRYALSQRNNHAISEAVFLETAAVAGAAGNAEGRAGRRALLEAVADQFYDDGWYAQHSFNYQRLAMHALLWLHEVRRVAGLEPGAAEPLQRSAALMRVCQDGATGQLPNFGPNDCALLFPLTTCELRDFRPLLATSGRHAASGQRGMPRWNEEGIWLTRGRPDGSDGPAPSDRHVATMRSSRTHVVVRTGSGRHRAGHDDLLHLDMWVDGDNVLADPGTYRYTAFAPWTNALASRQVHNVPYSEEATGGRLGRFLPLTWPTAQLLRHEALGQGLEVLELVGTEAEARWRRSIVRRGDAYLVVDDAGGKRFAVRWTFGSAAESRRTTAGTEIIGESARAVVYSPVEELHADESDPASGWISPGYGGRRPTTAIVARSDGPPLIAAFAPLDAHLPVVDLRRIQRRDGEPTDWFQ